MRHRKVIFPLLILAGLILLATGPAAPQESRPRLAQVVYITQSDACGCSAKRFKTADAVVDRLFTGARQALLKRIDYATDRPAAVPYIGQFRLVQLPALLFLDSQGNSLWSAIGTVGARQVEEKLAQFGG